MKKAFNVFANLFITLPLLITVFVIGVVIATIGIILYYIKLYIFFIAEVKVYCRNMPIAMYRGNALFWIEQEYI